MTALDNAAAIFEIGGEPFVQVTFWSAILQAWVYIVGTKSGNNLPGTWEITPLEIARMQMLVDEGWPRATAIYRVMGVRVVAP